MSREAHALLNAAKQGANVSRREILEALRATGDLDPIRAGVAPEAASAAYPVDPKRYGVIVTPTKREAYAFDLPKLVFEPWTPA